MVLHPEACWGGLPTSIQKTNILETVKFVTYTRHFQEKHLAGAFRSTHLAGNHLAGTFQKTFSGNICKKHLAGIKKKHFAETISKTHLAGTFWQEHFGGIFFYNSKTLQMLFFKIKVQKLNPEVRCHYFVQYVSTLLHMYDCFGFNI